MLADGFAFCWRDRGIALVLGYLLVMSFFLHGVLLATLPLFTKLHLALDVDTYGALYAFVGMGTIVGIAAGVVISPADKNLGMLVLSCDLVAGLCLFFIGLSTYYVQTIPLFCLLGFCAGIIMVTGTTWFQKRTPDELMGRVLSILMFAVFGLVPLSATLAGLLMEKIAVTSVMMLAGGVMVFLVLVGFCFPRIRMMGLPRF